MTLKNVSFTLAILGTEFKLYSAKIPNRRTINGFLEFFFFSWWNTLLKNLSRNLIGPFWCLVVTEHKGSRSMKTVRHSLKPLKKKLSFILLCITWLRILLPKKQWKKLGAPAASLLTLCAICYSQLGYSAIRKPTDRFYAVWRIKQLGAKSGISSIKCKEWIYFKRLLKSNKILVWNAHIIF